jgi:hypothetical protein
VPYQGVNATGWAICGASVARARVVRGMEHGCVVFYAVGEGSPTASGDDASLEVIGPLLPHVCCCNYCRPAFGHINYRAYPRG